MLRSLLVLLMFLVAGDAAAQSVRSFWAGTGTEDPTQAVVYFVDGDEVTIVATQETLLGSPAGSSRNPWAVGAKVSYHFQDGDFFDGVSLQGVLARELFSKKVKKWGIPFVTTLANPKIGEGDEKSLEASMREVADGDGGLSFGFNPYYAVTQKGENALLFSSKIEGVYHHAIVDSSDAYFLEGALAVGLEGHIDALSDVFVIGFEYRFTWYGNEFKELFEREEEQLNSLTAFTNFTIPELDFGGTTGFQFRVTFTEDTTPSYRMGFLVRAKKKDDDDGGGDGA